MHQLLLKLPEYGLVAFAIIFLLGGVIAVHELGHFLFAKWCNIRVDMFSIGFGPKLWSRKFGETEYCLSLIPLGGFVKIYGQDPEELTNDPEPKPDRAFVKKSLIQKIGVLSGGPLFNYILAILIFAGLAVAGVQKLPAVATRVVAETPAYKAGLRSGDVILAVNGQTTRTFEELLDLIAQNPEKTMNFSVLRDGAPYNLDVAIQKENALTPYGEESIAGVLEGLDPLAHEPVMATTSPQHPWGFQNGDRILEINDVKIVSWEDMEKQLERMLPSLGEKIRFKVQRGETTAEVISPDLKPLVRKLPKREVHEFLEMADIQNPELFIKEVQPDSPAAKAGLRPGDRVISGNGQRVFSFDHLKAVIQGAGEEIAKKAKAAGQSDPSLENAVRLNVEREGKRIELTASVRATKEKNPLGEVIVTYTVGILSAGRPMMPPNLIVDRTLNPFRALWIGAGETASNTVMTVVGIKKLIFGEVSAKTVGGPIMIGKLAGDAAKRSWREFFHIMAIISISLGVFNLLPVPILDGGHIVFAVMESLRGEPLSQRTQQTVLKVGLSLILVLMVFAFYNDITRFVPLPF